MKINAPPSAAASRLRQSMKTSPSSRVASARPGQAAVKVVGGLVVCSAVGLFAFLPTADDPGTEDGNLLVHTVERGDFVSAIVETGDIESASNDEVRCEVRSTGGAWTTIVEIVDEGTLVKKGDFLLQFDDSDLTQQLTQQEIVVATDEAGLIQAKAELQKAIQALNEYQKGTYHVELETLEGELFQATSHYKSAEDSLAHAQRMFKKGYVSKIQLEAEELAVSMAQKAEEVARIKVRVLKDITFQKMVSEFEAEVEKQRAMKKAAEQTLKLSQQRRDELAEQVAKCRCVAPRDGQVVYANDYGREIVIEEGINVREGQVVIRLPDPKQMQVDTRINDSKINRVQVGAAAEITLDVDPDLVIRGELAEVEPFPYPRRWHGGPIQYGAVVKILDPPATLRPGQRARVRIFAEQMDDVLQTPVQSVVTREDSHFCLVRDGSQWQARRVSLGPNNDSFVVVESGLSDGDVVALNPDEIWDQVTGETADQPDAADAVVTQAP